MKMDKDKDKHYKEIPATGIAPPMDTSPTVQPYEPVKSASQQSWADRDLTQLKNFNQGLTFSSNVPPKSYDIVLKNLLYILETGVKNGNKNDQLLTKVQITAIFKSLMSSIEVLKSLNLDVDKNEIIAILHGYITGCINSYEK